MEYRTQNKAYVSPVVMWESHWKPTGDWQKVFDKQGNFTSYIEVRVLVGDMNPDWKSRCSNYIT